ncbi:DUF2231 domain-containing protein [Kibdelosporangium persicum]|nr:DUF2231 domain-containing protein [Kibdelosporangium persicum]
MRAVENLRAVDRPAATVAAAVRRGLKASKADGALRGSWLGHPLHPLMVTVPIGAWVSAAVLDAGNRNDDAARKLIAIGLTAAPPTILLGLADYGELDKRQRRVGLVHAVTNAAAVGCFAASYQLRRRGRHTAGKLMSTLALTVLSTGGALGGHLSYAQGAGVHRWQAPRSIEDGTVG